MIFSNLIGGLMFEFRYKNATMLKGVLLSVVVLSNSRINLCNYTQSIKKHFKCISNMFNVFHRDISCFI